MDINNFIVGRGKSVSGHLSELDQITFAIVHALDKENKHIPDWYKTLRVGNIVDSLIKERIITTSQVRYRFSLGYGFDTVPFNNNFRTEYYQLCNFTVFDLSLDELLIVSRKLATNDNKDEISFSVSDPYYLDEDKLLQKYKFFCKLCYEFF